MQGFRWLGAILVGSCLAADDGAALEALDVDAIRGSSLEELMDLRITTTTSLPEPLDRTTSTVTVITRETIDASGARDLHDVLDLVPGIRVATNYLGQATVAVRGLRTSPSAHVLFLLDGESLNGMRTGSATFDFLDDLPLANVERIEIVRGPGSALYGANAFSAVINVIRSDVGSTTGARLSVAHEFEGAGDVGQRYELLWGAQRGDATWELQLGLDALDGPELVVAADALGRPGRADTRKDRLDLQLRGSRGDLDVDFRWFDRDAGGQFGILSVVGGDSRQRVRSGSLGLEWAIRPADDLTLRTDARVGRHVVENEYEGLPAGSIPPGHPYEAWNATGLLGNPSSTETMASAGVQAEWRVGSNRTLVVGTEVRHDALHDASFHANYDPMPLPEVQDVSDRFNWIEEQDRTLTALYAQDVWDVARDWHLVTGVRWDHFSDFGSTVNPRVGLSWQSAPWLTMRASYGRAYRAPDFLAMGLKNNPAVVGNPDLEPERVATWQASAEFRRGTRLRGSVTGFRSHAEDLIRSPLDDLLYRNVGSFDARGIESDLRFALTEGIELGAVHAWVRAEDGEGSVYRDFPAQSGALFVQLRESSGVRLRLTGSWQGESPRAPDDPDPAAPGHFVTDLSFGAPVGRSGLEFLVSAFNLFDVDHAYPAAEHPIPGDYTAPGRSLMIGLRVVR